MEHVLKIKGRKWRVLAVDGLYEKYGVYGDCDHPSKHRKAIRYEPAQNDSQLLDTVLHEALHAVHPEFTEDAITLEANALSDIVELVFDLKRKDTPCASE